MTERPIIGITLGDPAGIGPEIVVKSLCEPDVYLAARPLVIGSPVVVERARLLVRNAPSIRLVHSPGEGHYRPGTIDVLATGGGDEVEFGEVQAAAGRAAFAYVTRAIELARSGAIDAIATAPINKEALVTAGVPYIDHTAMLGDLGGRIGALLTLFVTDRLRIFFATRHRSLKDAIGDLSVAGLVETIAGASDALSRYGETAPHFALAALNPHGGEDGLFGDEEVRILRPAVDIAKSRGIDISGPYPADSVFVQAARGRFDAVISLYHDQGHIAAKMHSFERTVSLTVGLPFVRTSVDHGTAFDIAGRGVANAVSMIESIKVAADYVEKLKYRAASAS